MRKKQLVILTLTSLLSVSAVYAKKPLIALPPVITDAIKFLFVDLMKLSSSDAGVAYLKLILWLILSAFIYFGLDKGGLFGQRKGVAAFIAALISLTGVIFIPTKLVVGIFSIHSTVIGITAGLAPVGVAFYFNHAYLKLNTLFHRVFRAVIYIAMAIITYALIVVISEI